MVYKRTHSCIDVLAVGEVGGHKYVVVSYGDHPCAYVSVPKGSAINISDVYCHGGVTYEDKKLPHKELEELFDDVKDSWWIGWDYAHWNDYSGLLEEESRGVFGNMKKWTTDEIEEECLNVIGQIVENEE